MAEGSGGSALGTQRSYFDEKNVPLAIPPQLSPGLFVPGYGITLSREQTLIEGSNNCYNHPTAFPPEIVQISGRIPGFSEHSSEVSHQIDTFYSRIHHDSSPTLECITKENDIPQWYPNHCPSCYDSYSFPWDENNGRINLWAGDELNSNQVRIKLSLTKPKINLKQCFDRNVDSFSAHEVSAFSIGDTFAPSHFGDLSDVPITPWDNVESIHLDSIRSATEVNTPLMSPTKPYASRRGQNNMRMTAFHEICPVTDKMFSSLEFR